MTSFHSLLSSARFCLQAADYSTYHNTMGRRSTLMGGGGGGAPYTHMSKYSYPTDMSLSSHYGYTSWGLWRDNRNLSSPMYGKKQKNFRSVSVLLLSAAFIVVLAILCVVGLAFYLSAFKSDLSECEYHFPYIFCSIFILHRYSKRRPPPLGETWQGFFSCRRKLILLQLQCSSSWFPHTETFKNGTPTIGARYENYFRQRQKICLGYWREQRVESFSSRKFRM